jgi:hypothetical protein
MRILSISFFKFTTSAKDNSNSGIVMSMNLLLGLTAGGFFLYSAYLNNRIKLLTQQQEQTSRWCAVMEIVLKESGVWVYDKKQNKYVPNKNLVTDEEISKNFPD